jgi:membrane protein required for colicin V production
MNLWDVLIIFLLGWRIHSGWRIGFINEVFRLAAVVCGAAGALLLAPRVVSWLGGFIRDPATARLAALGLAFIFIAVLMLLVGVVLTKIASLMLLGLVNRSLGAAFGVLSGLMLALLISLLVSNYAPQWGALYVRHSLTGRIAKNMADHIKRSLPADLGRRLPQGTTI